MEFLFAGIFPKGRNSKGTAKESREIKRVRFKILESDIIPHPVEGSIEDGIIHIILPDILAIFLRVMKSVNKEYKLNASTLEILEIKTGKYKDSPTINETFAKIKFKIDEVLVEGYIGKAVGFQDEKKVQIFFEKGIITVNLVSESPSARMNRSENIDEELYEKLKKDFEKNEGKNPQPDENKRIKEIASIVGEKRGEPVKYEKFSPLNEILMKFEPFDDKRYKAYIDVLLNQYNDLRAEITQCIYLEHAAIITFYTFQGIVVAFLLREGITPNSQFIDSIHQMDIGKAILLLSMLILAQTITINFGSLFLKEQARNRRACSFQKAIEYLINKKIKGIGIYWENYITSKLVNKKISKWEYFKLRIPINREYYINRLFSIGLPIFLANILITFCIGYISYIFLGRDIPAISVSLIISAVITIWASRIMRKTFLSLGEEELPSRDEVLTWIEGEYQELLSSTIFE